MWIYLRIQYIMHITNVSNYEMCRATAWRQIKCMLFRLIYSENQIWKKKSKMWVESL